ncbi:MAG: hypothetical protein AAGA74_16245 [Pseudomonadota bacterium]
MTITTIKNREIGIADWPKSQPALKEDAIRYAGILLNRDEVDLPKSADDDEIEVRLESETKRLLAEIDSEYNMHRGELSEVQAQIEMRTDAADGIKSALVNGVVEDHQHHSAIDADLKVTERQASIALTAEKTRRELTRGPKPNTTSAVTGFAIGFAGVEALVTAASFIGQTGASGAAGAVGLALTAACTNIGLGGYLAGTVLIPRASRKNSSLATAWLYRLLLLMSVAWLVTINFLLGHFRATSGDFGAAFVQFLSNPLNVGDMTGLLLVGFGFILSAIWCLKFYVSQDSYLEYGSLGEELRSVRSQIINNRSTYTRAVRGRADDARDELNEAVEEAVAGHQLARELKTRADDLVVQQAKDQEEVLLKATETAIYRRSVLREMLSPLGDVPGYIATPVDYTDLRLSPRTAESEAAFAAQTEQAKIAIISTCTSAKDDIEKIVAQAISLSFGATIYPTSMTGGQYVEQSSH